MSEIHTQLPLSISNWTISATPNRVLSLDEQRQVLERNTTIHRTANGKDAIGLAIVNRDVIYSLDSEESEAYAYCDENQGLSCMNTCDTAEYRKRGLLNTSDLSNVIFHRNRYAYFKGYPVDINVPYECCFKRHITPIPGSHVAKLGEESSNFEFFWDKELEKGCYHGTISIKRPITEFSNERTNFTFVIGRNQLMQFQHPDVFNINSWEPCVTTNGDGSSTPVRFIALPDNFRNIHNDKDRDKKLKLCLAKDDKAKKILQALLNCFSTASYNYDYDSVNAINKFCDKFLDSFSVDGIPTDVLENVKTILESNYLFAEEFVEWLSELTCSMKM